MKKKVMFMLLNVDIDRYPLIPSYLEGYACLDPEIEKYWDFKSHINSNSISPARLESYMQENNADVYAFSCYVWNMGLIKKAIYSYLEKKPETNIILGGPQVTHQGEKYLCKEYENMVICNGEGEKIFKTYLKELMKECPDYSHVSGLSYYKNNSLITTRDEEQIKNPDELPSPFQNRFFDSGDYRTADIETSRGCPFSCKYCYWSSGLGSKSVRFSQERIKADIECIAQKNISFLFIADSNFGLFPQDLETAKFIVKCKEKYGFPEKIYFSSSRNNFQRVGEIAKIFSDADIYYSCEIPLQTINDTAMKMIDRKQNIDSYLSLSKYLNGEGINSYVELIWPLPGETLDSFKQGIAKLCEMKTNTFIVYTFFFMNNIALENHKEEYGIVTNISPDKNSEAEFVIRTNEVNDEECIEGWRFVHAVTVLYSLRGLFMTARYLNDSNLENYDDLFCKFASFTKSKRNMPGFTFLENMKQEKTIGSEIYGSLSYDVCHGKRDIFDSLLYEFVSAQHWWSDKTAQLFFEVDLLNRGYIYSVPIKHEQYPFKYLKIIDTLSSGYVVEIPSPFEEKIKDMLSTKASFSSNCAEINYIHSQKPLKENSSQEEITNHCYRMFYNAYSYMPEWRNRRLFPE